MISKESRGWPWTTAAAIVASSPGQAKKIVISAEIGLFRGLPPNQADIGGRGLPQ
jgi:hypothetical protein